MVLLVFSLNRRYWIDQGPTFLSATGRKKNSSVNFVGNRTRISGLLGGHSSSEQAGPGHGYIIWLIQYDRLGYLVKWPTKLCKGQSQVNTTVLSMLTLTYRTLKCFALTVLLNATQKVKSLNVNIIKLRRSSYQSLVGHLTRYLVGHLKSILWKDLPLIGRQYQNMDSNWIFRFEIQPQKV